MDVSVQFEYFTYGGSGADGIAFFLYDASVDPFNIGAFGGSLGYAQRINPTEAGLSKGFVAIGLDEFGNFSSPTTVDNEGRQGGPGNRPSSVTLRGSGDGNGQVSTNYEYLTSIQTSNQTDMTNAGAGTAFQIAGGVDGRTGGGLTSASAGYRKVKMDLVPNGIGTGFNITVIITENTIGGLGNLNTHKVIDNYPYIPDDGIPATLSYGFSASTGGSNNFHEIRNIDILAAVAVAPTAVADAATTPEDTPVTFNIVTNDSDQNGNSTLNSANGVDLIPGSGIDLSRTVTGEGTYTYNGNGTVTFVPVANFNGTSTISYTINDGALTSSVVNIVVTVTAVNDAPVAVADVNTVTEDVTLTVAAVAGLLSNDTDAENSPLTITQYFIAGDLVAKTVATPVVIAGVGTINIAADGGYSFVPASNYTGAIPVITYTASDGALTATSTLTLTITAVNDAPTFTLAANQTVTACGVAQTVTSFATNISPGPADENAQTVAFTLTNNNNSLFSTQPAISTGGNLTYTPAATANGSATVTVVLTDSGASTTQTFTITVNGAAQPSTISGSDVVCIGTSHTYTVTLVAGHTYTWTYSNPAGVTFTPTPEGNSITVNYANTAISGTWSVTATATGGCPSTPRTLAVVVNSTPQPGAITGTASVCAGSTGVSYSVSAVANTTYNWTYSGTGATIASGGGTNSISVNYASNATVGTWSVVATGPNTCPSLPQTFAVTAVNASPTVAAITGTSTVAVGSTTTLANTTAGGVWSSSNTSIATVNSTGAVTGVAAGDATISYTVTSGGCSAIATKVITVSAGNTPPVAVADSYTVARGGTLTQTTPGVLINDTDAENSTLTAVLVLGPANGTLTLNSNGSFTYVHNGTNTFFDSFTYKANDGTNDGNTVNVNITISATNNAPIAQNDTYTVAHNGTTMIAAPGVLNNDTDLNSDPITAIIVTGPVHGTLTLNSNGSFTYINNGGSATSDSFTYKVNDGKVDGNTVTVTLNIVRPNQAPLAVADTYNTSKGSVLTVSAPGVLGNDSDADGNSITAIKVSNPSHGTLVFNSNGSFTYTHDNGSSISDSFEYKVSDGTIEGNTVTVTLFIVAPGALPIISDVNVMVHKDEQYSFTAINFTEKFVDLQQHDLLKVKIVTLPTSGKLRLDGVNVSAGQEILAANLSKLSFTPESNFIGLVSFLYNSSCSVGYALADKNVNMSVVDAGVPPVAVADNYTLSSGNTLTVASPGVLANDIDAGNHTLTAIKVTDPAHGSLTLNANGSFSYTHNAGTATSDTFSYMVNNGYHNSNIVNVNISIPRINIPPVLSNVYYTSNNSSLIVFKRADFSSKFSDTDTMATVRWVTLPSQGILRVNGVPAVPGQELITTPNLVTYEPPLNWSGTTSFLWNASDGTVFATNNAQVIITITQPVDPGAKIGLAKQLASSKANLNGTYDLKFIFTVVNYGTNGLNKVSVKDNLALAFSGAEVKVKGISATGNLRANNAFTGISDTELLLSSSKLNGAEEAKIELDLNVKLGITGGIFSNSATAEGESQINGFKVNDVSTNGLKPDPNLSGDVSPSESTEIKLDILPSYVPAGFSPNGDGTNDKFIIQNADGKQVSLEMYNRWGNRVYRSEDYKNDWGGEVTEGFFLGRDIPDGTYYYIIIIDKKDKYTGFITVNR